MENHSPSSGCMRKATNPKDQYLFFFIPGQVKFKGHNNNFASHVLISNQPGNLLTQTEEHAEAKLRWVFPFFTVSPLQKNNEERKKRKEEPPHTKNYVILLTLSNGPNVDLHLRWSLCLQCYFPGGLPIFHKHRLIHGHCFFSTKVAFAVKALTWKFFYNQEASRVLSWFSKTKSKLPHIYISLFVTPHSCIHQKWTIYKNILTEIKIQPIFHWLSLGCPCNSHQISQKSMWPLSLHNDNIHSSAEHWPTN